MKKAGTGEKGQLSRKHSGLLLVGGFHLRESDLQALELAAEEYLRNSTKRGKHSHLMAIAVLSFGVHVEANAQDATLSLSGAISTRIVQNRGFVGSIKLDNSGRGLT